MSFQRVATSAPRLLLGTIFFVFGLNFFLHFLPLPSKEGAPLAFIEALVASGFVMPIVKTVEVIAGLMLLSNRFVPLALALLAPIVVAIVGFHTVLAPEGAGVAFLVLGLELAVAWTYRAAFAPMLRARTEVAHGATRRPVDAVATA